MFEIPDIDVHLATQQVENISIDAHPVEQSIILKYQTKQIGTDILAENGEFQKIINLKDLNSDVDISVLAEVILEKCSIIPDHLRHELEQVLFYLQKRTNSVNRKSTSSISSLLNENGLTCSIKADIDQIENYIELFYENVADKNRGVLCILELTKTISNLQYLIENETLIGALARVFREDWRKNFDLGMNIIKIFVELSSYNQFQATLSHHRIGALCLNAIEYELRRGDIWADSIRNGDEKTAKKCRLAIRKQHILLAACINLLINLAHDVSVELKMVRRDIVPMLLKCLDYRDSRELILVTVQFLLKLSIFEENKAIMEQANIVNKLLILFPIVDSELRRSALRLLFNLSFDSKSRAKMVAGGLVSHVAPLIESDSKALNLLYQLSLNDDAKAMITFTDAIQLLMRDILSGGGNEVTKAVLLNACIERRNAQLVCGPDGQGLDLLMDLSLEGSDLLVAKIVRCIASHEGPTQDMFVKWMSRLLETGINEVSLQVDERAAIALEFIGTAAQIRVADWVRLCNGHHLVSWMGEQLKSILNGREPLQLQLVIMCGSMARQLEAARNLIPLLDVFLQLLHSMQEDDEFVVQLLYLFLQLLRHKELSDRLMGPHSALGAYVIDLMHDKNPSVRAMCENALIIIGEQSQEWACRIAGERFRWHNAQWLETVAEGDISFEDTPPLEEDYGADVLFDDQFDDGFDLVGDEALF